MPYQGEFAGYSPVKRLVESKRVRELLGKYTLVAPPQTVSADSDFLSCTVVTLTELSRRNGWLPDYILSIDGSNDEVEVDNGYPKASVGYLTTVAVLLKLKEMQRLDASRPVDPKAFRETRTTDPVDTVLPGCNVTYEGEVDARSSLRRGVIELFANQQAFDTGEMLLDTYHELLKSKPVDNKKQNCPYGEDCGFPDGIDAYQRGVGTYECPCQLKRPFHSTDALRFHERFNLMGENGAIYTEIMQVVERLWLIHVLRGMEARGYLNALSRLAVIVDGPLAIFGQPSWLSRAIAIELARLNEELRKTTGIDLLIVGVEKDGFFVEHFRKLCEAADKGAIPSIKPQTAFLLTDEYIKKQIIFSEGPKIYGEANYFGRKVLYRTKSGARIVATLPFFTPEQRDITTAKIEQFPRLADALNVFDALVSSRYPNALVPISLAHSEAAIPLRHGGRVLETLAREIIKSGANK